MKFLSIILVLLTSIFLTGCTKQEVNNGLYGVISLPLFAGFVIFLLQAKKAYDSGSTQQTKTGIVSSDKKAIPWGKLFFAILFLLGSLGSAKWIYEENRNYDPAKDKPYPEKPTPDGRESAEDQAKKADSVYNLKK